MNVGAEILKVPLHNFSFYCNVFLLVKLLCDYKNNSDFMYTGKAQYKIGVFHYYAQDI